MLGCGGGGVGSWLSSFLERTSLKSVRMTETPQRYWSCLVTSGIDSFRLQRTGRQRRQRAHEVKYKHLALKYTNNRALKA